MGDFRYDDQIRRMIREIQLANLQAVASEVPAMAQQIQQLRQSVGGEQLAQNLAALRKAILPRIPDVVRMINAINAQRTREIVEGLAEFAKAARDLRERALPPNWSDFTEDEIKSIVALMQDTGWSLVWVPRAEIIQQLLDANEGDREDVLATSVTEILDDLDAALSEVEHTQLADLRDAATHAIGAFRAGFPGPAQSYAATVFTTTMHVHLGLKKFPAAREEFSKHDPMEVEIMLFKLAAIYGTAARAIETYWGKDDEPIPTNFNRHASTHRVSEVQYTTVNALAALLLVTSLLRELEPLFHLQFPERNDDA